MILAWHSSSLHTKISRQKAGYLAIMMKAGQKSDGNPMSPLS